MTFRVRDLMAGVPQEQDKDGKKIPASCRMAQDSCGGCTNNHPCDKHTKKSEHPDPDKAATLGLLRSAIKQALAQG